MVSASSNSGRCNNAFALSHRAHPNVALLIRGPTSPASPSSGYARSSPSGESVRCDSRLCRTASQELLGRESVPSVALLYSEEATMRKELIITAAAGWVIGMTSLPALAASAFEGVWQVKDTAGKPFEITLSSGGAAKATRGEVHGRKKVMPR